MSVHWIIDELRRPISLHAHLTLALYQHQRSSIRGVAEVARLQMRFWNELRRETRLPDGRPAELRFTVRLRPMRENESAVFDSLVMTILEPNSAFPRTVPLIPESNVGPALGRIGRALQTAPDYREGLAFVMAAHAGMPTKVPLGARGSVVSWHYEQIESDRLGPAESLCLAHEIGHLLWLDEAYVAQQYRPARDSSGDFETQSREGYERNIMGDFWSDLRRRPRRGRPWLGFRQAREMAIHAYRALDRSIWPTEALTVTVSTVPAFFATRYPKQL